VIVRRERPTDRAASRAVQAAAFDQGEGEPVEARLLDQLRECDGWLPALSWVAEIDGQVVGHNICTRGYVDNVSAVGLGPIGVMPDSQRTGVGSALMHAMIGAADAAGEPLIALLGDPGYYSQFGFLPSTYLGVAPPEMEWGRHFQVLPLSAWKDSITGSFRYSTPFDEIR
jgi:putative acetyltransferase